MRPGVWTATDALDALEARRNRRARQILLATGAMVLLLGLGWGAFFLARGAYFLVLVEMLLAGLGATVIVLARRQHMRLAAWTAFAGLFAFVCVFSAFVDIQTAQVPRSTHLFLLVLAGGAHHVFRAEPPWLRHGCVLAFLLAFVAFAAMPETAPTRYAMDLDVRRWGVWINLSTVVASLMVVLHLQESDAAAHRRLHRELRDALAARRFELFYQPQYDTHGRAVGAEALLRWRDPVRGLLPPGEFVRAAEETGFILPLGQWVLGAACSQLRQWQSDPALAQLRLSINISAMQLQQPDFVEQVLDALQRSGVDARRLTLELTESVLLQDIDASVAKMQALQEAGVRLSMDDFGTGYSSLAYLHQMPFAELKIDRAFVAGVDHDPQARSITRNLLQLGQDLGIDVIAEGVERREQYELLRSQGCSFFQGFLFAAPMDLAAFERLVQAQPD